MAVEITWIGHASFRLTGDSSVVYIDPWKLPDAPHDASVVVVSHEHDDHLSAEDVAGVSKFDTAVVAPPSAAGALPGAVAMSPGDCTVAGGVEIEAVAAYNIFTNFHPRASGWIGVVVTLEGKRIYYAGDTDSIDEMEELGEIDVALLPVGGTFTLDAAGAAHAVKRIGCKAAIPYHWGNIVGSAYDAQAFAYMAGCEVTILQPGGTLTL